MEEVTGAGDHPLESYLNLRRQLIDGTADLDGSWVQLTAAMDRGVQALSQKVEDFGPPRMAAVALGSYGRRQLCIHSDIDLMILVEEPVDTAPAVFRALWDAGLTVGHAVRTPAEAGTAAGERTDTLCSLLDARLVCGDAALFQNLQTAVDRTVRRSSLTVAPSTRAASSPGHRSQERSRRTQDNPQDALVRSRIRCPRRRRAAAAASSPGAPPLRRPRARCHGFQSSPPRCCRCRTRREGVSGPDLPVGAHNRPCRDGCFRRASLDGSQLTSISWTVAARSFQARLFSATCHREPVVDRCRGRASGRQQPATHRERTLSVSGRSLRCMDRSRAVIVHRIHQLGSPGQTRHG